MESIVPAVELPPTAPPADHVTPVVAKPVTVAENWKVAPVPTEPSFGDTVMLCASRSGLTSNATTVNRRQRLLIDKG